MDESPLRRRRLLINPRFQLSFLAFTLATSVATLGVFYLSDYFFIRHFVQAGRALGLPGNHVLFSFLNEERHYMNTLYGVTSIFALGILMAGGLLLSHKVAGPLHRLKTHFKNGVDSKEPSGEVTFRRGDYFQDLADAYNRQQVKKRESNQSGGSGKRNRVA